MHHWSRYGWLVTRIRLVFTWGGGTTFEAVFVDQSYNITSYMFGAAAAGLLFIGTLKPWHTFLHPAFKQGQEPWFSGRRECVYFLSYHQYGFSSESSRLPCLSSSSRWQVWISAFAYRRSRLPQQQLSRSSISVASAALRCSAIMPHFTHLSVCRTPRLPVAACPWCCAQVVSALKKGIMYSREVSVQAWLSCNCRNPTSL